MHKDFDDPCVRSVWEAVIPASFVLIRLVTLAVPKRLSNHPVWILISQLKDSSQINQRLAFIKIPFTTFLSLKDAEAYQPGEHSDETAESVPLWRSLSLSSIALLETVAWTTVGGYSLIVTNDPVWKVWTPFTIAFSWLYASIRPLVRRRHTPPYDLFILYLLHLTSAALNIGAMLYDRALGRPRPSQFLTATTMLDLAAIIIALGLVLRMPVAQPSTHVDKSEIGVSISPEDYTSLWGWVTFSWVTPLVEKVREF